MHHQLLQFRRKLFPTPTIITTTTIAVTNSPIDCLGSWFL